MAKKVAALTIGIFLLAVTYLKVREKLSKHLRKLETPLPLGRRIMEVDPDSIISKPVEERPERRISTETARITEKMKAWAAENSFTFGEAIDNGDCFYDSIAQLLTEHLGRLVTVKELRKIVDTEVKKLDETRNWVIERKGQIDSSFDWLDYRMVAGFTARELSEEAIFNNRPPTWGDPEVEGQILCEHFGINLHLIGATGELEIKEFEVVSPNSKEPTFDIYIGHLSGHFTPLHNVL